MSVGMKVICKACGESAYVGTLNSRTCEEPDELAEFLWRHYSHDVRIITESDPYYEVW